MLEIEPSIFCAICVSISVGAAPGSVISTFTSGNDTSGLRFDRQTDEGDHAHEEQHDEQDDGRDRMADCPG